MWKEFILLWCSFTLMVAAQRRYPGVVEPKDSEVTIGGTLNVTCTGSNQSRPYDIYFTKKDVIITSEMMETLSTEQENYTKSRLIIKNVTTSHAGFYNCIAFYHATNTTETMERPYVTVIVPPLKPAAVDCVLHNWIYLHCFVTPTYAEQKRHTVSGKISMNLIVSYQKKNEHYELDKSTSSCIIPLDQEARTQAQLKVSAEVVFTLPHININKTGEENIINLPTIVKPDMVSDLTVSDQTTSSVTLSWTHPVKNRELVYNITYKQEWEEEWEEIILENSTSHYVFNDLTPFSTLDVTVRVKPAVGGLWSDAVNIAGKTLADVPYVAPEIATGSYEILEKRNGMIHLILYWKELPIKNHNGNNLTYILSTNGGEKCSDFQFSEWIFSSNSSKAEIQVSNCELIHISLLAVNEIGPTQAGNMTWNISTSNSVPFPAEFEVALGTHDDVGFSWTDGGHGNISGHTLYWCKGSSHDKRCTDEMDWITFFPSVTNHMMNIPDATSYIYGISTDIDGKSSGIQFTDCLYHVTKRPSPPTGVQLSQTHDDKSITIEWNQQSCKEQQGKVTGYSIFYCEVYQEECQGKEIRLDIGSETFLYKISNLQPHTKYKVSVSSYSTQGISVRSRAIYHKVSGWTQTEYILLGLGCLFILALVILGTIQSIKFFQQKYMSFTRGIDIKIPESNKLPSNRYCTQISKYSYDSGRGSSCYESEYYFINETSDGSTGYIDDSKGMYNVSLEEECQSLKKSLCGDYSKVAEKIENYNLPQVSDSTNVSVDYAKIAFPLLGHKPEHCSKWPDLTPNGYIQQSELNDKEIS